MNEQKIKYKLRLPTHLTSNYRETIMEVNAQLPNDFRFDVSEDSFAEIIENSEICENLMGEHNIVYTAFVEADLPLTAIVTQRW